jgi:hypothetical protein
MHQQTRRGWRSHFFDKTSIFDPNEIREINYGVGRHTCTPQGCVVWAAEPVRLLHYKYLGLDYLRRRTAELAARRRAGDISQNFGTGFRQSTRKPFLCI